jgi:predicted DNA-binding protein with PD1-like motif
MSYTGKFEIVSLTGTLSVGCHHLHVAIADSTGAVFGGHLLPGCVVRTTAEIVLVRCPILPQRQSP